eukprot:1842664-Pyramimonas_sp.AAC.1
MHLCGRASPRMLARAAAGWFGATDVAAMAVAAMAVTAGYFPVGISVRVGGLGGRGFSATSTT